MKKFHVTIQFEMDDDFMSLVAPHRTYINHLITKEIIEHYAVSMESQQIWITMNAEDKDIVQDLVSKSPLYKYFTMKTDELFVLDGQNYRLPTFQNN